jgi:hypothetical protein
VDARVRPQLAHGVADVGANGLRREEQARGDLLTGQSPGQQVEDLARYADVESVSLLETLRPNAPFVLASLVQSGRSVLIRESVGP